MKIDHARMLFVVVGEICCTLKASPSPTQSPPLSSTSIVEDGGLILNGTILGDTHSGS